MLAGVIAPRQWLVKKPEWLCGPRYRQGTNAKRAILPWHRHIYVHILDSHPAEPRSMIVGPSIHRIFARRGLRNETENVGEDGSIGKAGPISRKRTSSHGGAGRDTDKSWLYAGRPSGLSQSLRSALGSVPVLATSAFWKQWNPRDTWDPCCSSHLESQTSGWLVSQAPKKIRDRMTAGTHSRILGPLA